MEYLYDPVAEPHAKGAEFKVCDEWMVIQKTG